MQPVTKEFHHETPEKLLPEDWPRFHIGQEFTLNNVKMRIRKITRKDIILRPVK